MIFSNEQWEIIEHGLKKREIIIVQLPMYGAVAVDLKIKELLAGGRDVRIMYQPIAWDIVKIAARDGGFFRKLHKARLQDSTKDLEFKRYSRVANNLEKLLSVEIPRI